MVPQAKCLGTISTRSPLCGGDDGKEGSMTKSNDFDWNDDALTLHEQRETAIYWNTHGNPVIRQRPGLGEE
jgi:hypothetical protein